MGFLMFVAGCLVQKLPSAVSTVVPESGMFRTYIIVQLLYKIKHVRTDWTLYFHIMFVAFGYAMMYMYHL